MKLVNIEELKEKLDRGDNLLVNAVVKGHLIQKTYLGLLTLAK